MDRRSAAARRRHVAFSSVAAVIQNKCGGCHSTSARMPVLKNDADLRTTLTTYKVARCGNNPMVTPMDTAKSALVGVVSKSCMGCPGPPPATPRRASHRRT